MKANNERSQVRNISFPYPLNCIEFIEEIKSNIKFIDNVKNVEEIKQMLEEMTYQNFAYFYTILSSDPKTILLAYISNPGKQITLEEIKITNLKSLNFRKKFFPNLNLLNFYFLKSLKLKNHYSNFQFEIRKNESLIPKEKKEIGISPFKDLQFSEIKAITNKKFKQNAPLIEFQSFVPKRTMMIKANEDEHENEMIKMEDSIKGNGKIVASSMK